MGAQAIPPLPSPPLPESQPSWWQQHGTTAAWIAIVVVALVGLINTGTIWHFRNVDSESKTSDEHVKNLIHDQLNPSVDKVNDHIDKKVDPLIQKIDALSERVARLEGPLTKRVSGLETRLAQNEAMARVRKDPEEILDTIRAEIELAQKTKEEIPYPKLVDLKLAARALSPSAADYWKTVAAIVNYESFIDQLRGNAPDPRKVSGVCPGLTQGTGGQNRQIGGVIQNCIADLDTNAFTGVTFKNSVIRYHGGPVALANVQFVNCRFELNIPADTPPVPSRDRLLLAL